jgi:hypothetical protein
VDISSRQVLKEIVAVVASAILPQLHQPRPNLLRRSPDGDRTRFYTEKVGFNRDHDHIIGDEFRVVQLTPPGSACSIVLGTGIVDTLSGSVQGLHLVVSDINAARSQLVERGVEVSEVQTFSGDVGRLRDRPRYRTCTSRIPTGTAGPSSSCPISSLRHRPQSRQLVTRGS